MRLSLQGANPVERLALRAGVVPSAAAEAWGGMALSGVLIAAVRTGVTARLAEHPSTAEDLAASLGLDPLPARLLLDCLRSAGHVSCRAGRYRLSRSGRRWLHPDSGLSVARFVAGTADYWSWWSGLDEVTRGAAVAGHHDAPPGDPYWRRYIGGQFELARLSAAEVARKLRLPGDPRSVLDIGGGHGWYSAQLCRRYPHLTATVLDLPGSAAIGREIIAAAGLSDRVRHRDGDATMDDLGSGHDAVLCFNLVHHLKPDQIAGLLKRIHGALAPGGTLAVMDAFAEPDRRKSAAANFLGLFVYLSSGSQVHTPAQLREWLREAEFGTPRKIRILRIPGQAMYVVRKLLAGGGRGNGSRGGVEDLRVGRRRNGSRGGVGDLRVGRRKNGSRDGVGDLRVGRRGNGSHGGVEHLRVGHGHDAGAGVEADVADADLGDNPLDRPVDRARAQLDRVAHLERAGEQQHHPREYVRQRLLRRYPDEHAGQRATDDQLPDRNAEQHERHHQGGESSYQQHRVPDDRGMRGPHPGLERRARLAGQPDGCDDPEDKEPHGAGRRDYLARHAGPSEVPAEVVPCPHGRDGKGDREH
jgi:ubiquinone/menaquinone biosynthesis C-methylase UbiE